MFKSQNEGFKNYNPNFGDNSGANTNHNTSMTQSKSIGMEYLSTKSLFNNQMACSSNISTNIYNTSVTHHDESQQLIPNQKLSKTPGRNQNRLNKEN